GRNTKSRRTLHALLEGDEEICLSEIILMEILQGIRDDNQHAELKDYLLAFPILKNTPVQPYLHSSDIYRRCRKKGITIRKPVDCLISAVALENDAMLFHNDSDFEKIAKITDLRLY
ncbi:MAG: PIN domain nuclease, partial [Nitrospirota bacterium]|nr:PIN domain nuclease [Nitrospirota bacterium]